MFETERDYIHEEIKMIDAEIEPITQDLSSLKYKQTLGRYTDLSTEEGFITIAMIAMIVASIIAILAPSIDLSSLTGHFSSNRTGVFGGVVFDWNNPACLAGLSTR